MSTRIAGEKDDVKWIKFLEQLQPGGDRAVWQTVYDDYLYTRLNTRYLAPIKVIEESPAFNNKGEGFSIMAILCTLVEFLEAIRQGKEYRSLTGKNYRLAEKGDFHLVNPPFDPNNEYYKSKEYFVNFLKSQKPFRNFFSDGTLAEDFYSDIRCGLLHEAQTKNGWKIKVRLNKSNNKLIDVEKKFVYRDNFKDAFDEYLKTYKEELESNINLQKAFIRKFNSLCKKVK